MFSLKTLATWDAKWLALFQSFSFVDFFPPLWAWKAACRIYADKSIFCEMWKKHWDRGCDWPKRVWEYAGFRRWHCCQRAAQRPPPTPTLLVASNKLQYFLVWNMVSYNLLAKSYLFLRLQRVGMFKCLQDWTPVRQNIDVKSVCFHMSCVSSHGKLSPAPHRLWSICWVPGSVRCWDYKPECDAVLVLRELSLGRVTAHTYSVINGEQQ